MFERNSVDNGNELIAIAVEVDFDTGETTSGRFLMSRARDLHATLNSEDTFVIFEPYGKTRIYLAKSTLRSVRQVKPGSVPRLTVSVQDQDNFDPHRVLGLKPNAPSNEVREAWRQLSLKYHPDRYATAELPAEVVAYLNGMARQVNAAYELLEATAESRRRERLRAEHNKPIFEKPANI